MTLGGTVVIRSAQNPWHQQIGQGVRVGEVVRTELSGIGVKALIRHLGNPCCEKGMHTRSSFNFYYD